MAVLPDFDWSRAFWIAFGAILSVALLVVLHAFIGTFVFGIFLYYVTRPVYRRVRHRIQPPTLAALVALGLIALPVILLLSYTMAIGLQELSQLSQAADGNLGPLSDILAPYFDVSALVSDPEQILSDPAIREVFAGSLSTTVTYLGFIANGLVHFFIIFALAFYLLRDDHKLAHWAGRLVDDRGVLRAYARAVDQSFSKIFYGNILNAFLTGAIGAITFSILNTMAPAGHAIPYPALTGLLAGLASLIPLVGMKLVYVPLGSYLAFLSALDGLGWWFVGLFFLVAFIVVDTIPDLLIRPYVSGRSLHIGSLMFAYIFGPLLFGWYGIFLGPIILVLVFHFARIVLPELVAGDSIRPYSVDPGALIESRPVPHPPDEADPVSEASADEDA
jgi:predicted PurR-regulated permease PerM